MSATKQMVKVVALQRCQVDNTLREEGEEFLASPPFNPAVLRPVDEDEDEESKPRKVDGRRKPVAYSEVQKGANPTD